MRRANVRWVEGGGWMAWTLALSLGAAAAARGQAPGGEGERLDLLERRMGLVEERLAADPWV